MTDPSPDRARSTPRPGSTSARRFLRLHDPRFVAGIVVGLVLVVVLGWWFLVGADGDDEGGARSASSPAGSAASADPSPGTDVTLGSGKTVPVEPLRTAPAVPLQATADFGTGVSVRLSRVTPIQGRASGPGEIAGPALQVAVVAVNDSDGAASLDAVTVFATFGPDRSPAVPLSKGTRPFSGTLAPGGKATGLYSFNVPTGQRDTLRIEVSYRADAPTVVFRADADR